MEQQALQLSKHKVLIPTLFFIIFIFQACTTDNGPCDYDIARFDAKVTSITPYTENGDTLYKVMMDFNKSSLAKEEQDLAKLKDVTIDNAFIKKNRLAVGVIYAGTVSERTSGNCTPLFVSFDTGMSAGE
jgi:hypothetical protein